MRPRFAATAAPTSARCPARSSRAFAAPEPTIRSSCWTRWTRSAATSAAIRRRRCSRCSTRSRTSSSATIIWTCRSTFPRCCSSRTANVLDPIPDALRDRMEVLELPGYTEEEKIEIAKRHADPAAGRRARAEARRETSNSREEALQEMIRHYTREAGVRNLERNIATICRKQARRIAEGDARTRSQVTSTERGSGESWARRRCWPKPKWPSAPRRPAWRSAWPGRPRAATSSSSRPTRCPASAGSS